jgi:hypothetical protein
MRKRNKPKAVYTPEEREIILAIKQAVCKIYEITERDLLTNVSYSIAYLRFYCFWLLMRNTYIKDYAIAEAFGKTRSTVNYGVEQVDSQKDVYQETLKQLKMIAETANKSENKKYAWVLRLNSMSSRP